MAIPMPPAAGPDPGQPGHFAHHDWLEQAVLALDSGAGLTGPQSAQGGTNAITAGAWAALPSTPVSVNLDLPAPAWVLLNYGAWMAVNTAASGDVRCGVDVSGATVLPLVPGGPGNVEGEDSAWGDVLFIPTTAVGSFQHSGTRFVHCNPGITTFTMKAYRTATPACSVNYPVCRVIPLWFG